MNVDRYLMVAELGVQAFTWAYTATLEQSDGGKKITPKEVVLNLQDISNLTLNRLGFNFRIKVSGAIPESFDGFSTWNALALAVSVSAAGGRWYQLATDEESAGGSEITESEVVNGLQAISNSVLSSLNPDLTVQLVKVE